MSIFNFSGSNQNMASIQIASQLDLKHTDIGHCSLVWGLEAAGSCCWYATGSKASGIGSTEWLGLQRQRTAPSRWLWCTQLCCWALCRKHGRARDLGSQAGTEGSTRYWWYCSAVCSTQSGSPSWFQTSAALTAVSLLEREQWWCTRLYKATH